MIEAEEGVFRRRGCVILNQVHVKAQGVVAAETLAVGIEVQSGCRQLGVVLVHRHVQTVRVAAQL